MLHFRSDPGALCRTRKDKDGTVFLAVSETGEMNWYSGSVKCPADKAYTSTVAVSEEGDGACGMAFGVVILIVSNDF